MVLVRNAYSSALPAVPSIQSVRERKPLGHTQQLLARIEAFLRHQRNVSASKLGREAVNDPRLVFDLRAGATIGRRRRDRVFAWLEENGG